MKKSKILSLLLLFLTTSILYCQVGINTTTPNAALDVSSSTAGIVPPRVSLTANNVAAPVTNPQGGSLATGTIVYNTATVTGSTAISPGFYYWDGSKWARIKNTKSDTKTYAVYTNSASQTITALNTKLLFNTVSASGASITYSAGSFTLPPNKTYRIDFTSGFVQVSGAGYMRTALYNDTTNTIISTIAHNEMVTVTGGYFGNSNFTHFITVGSTAVTVSARVFAGSGLNFTVGDTASSPTLTIQAIN